MEKYGIIYKATNTVNGKGYIGQTTKTLDERISSHIYRAINKKTNFYFHNALRKYGKEKFVWEELCICSSLKKLNMMEVYYISQFDTFNGGYNLTTGGEGTPAHVLSVESRKKISETKMGYKYPPRSKEHCRKISEAKMGGKLAQTTIDKIVATRKANKGYAVGSKNILSKKFVIQLPDGTEFVVFGLMNFCKNYKGGFLSNKCLNSIALGHTNQHKGHKCRHYNEETDKNISIWSKEEPN